MTLAEGQAIVAILQQMAKVSGDDNTTLANMINELSSLTLTSATALQIYWARNRANAVTNGPLYTQGRHESVITAAMGKAVAGGTSTHKYNGE